MSDKNSNNNNTTAIAKPREKQKKLLQFSFVHFFFGLPAFMRFSEMNQLDSMTKNNAEYRPRNYMNKKNKKIVST